LVRKQLGQQASNQYESAAQYLSGQIPVDQWQHIGFQGLADVCVRMALFDHQQELINILPTAPIEVQAAICECLEHLTLTQPLVDAVFARFQQAPIEYKGVFLKALASHQPFSQEAIESLNKQNQLDDAMLITIAARNWNALKDDTTRKIFLEALAKQSQSFFNQVFADIVAIPSLRNALLTDLRNPERSAQLSLAIGGLFKAASL